jgi:hypothetical protein
LVRVDWRTVARALAGFAAGVAIWALVGPTYDRVIAAGAQATLRTFEHPKVTRLRVETDGFTTIDRSDFDPRSKRPAIAIHDLTFNFVLLLALFAASRRVFSDRNIGGFLVACAILALTHILAAVTEVMSFYVAKLGPWSAMHYGAVARNVWGTLNHFYRLVLMYAIAFGLWWALRDSGSAAPASEPKKRKKR